MSQPLSNLPEATTQDCGSSINSSLLTPPLTPRSNHDIPFQPTESDRTSLNLKKRSKQKRMCKSKRDGFPESRQNNSSNGLIADGRERSKSLIAYSKRVSGDISPGSINPSAYTVDRMQRMRRWTLPSKSTSTRCITPLRSTVKQATFGSAVESPAMITLRRATTSKSHKRMELTFFPEPRFSNERSSFLSYIVSTFSRTSLPSEAVAPVLHKSSSTRSDSVDSGLSRRGVAYPAATVFTEITVEPTLTSSSLTPPNCRSRRTSTRYVTGGTSYEIIWDENDSSTTQDSSRQSTVDRRSSVAVTKLEAQLCRASTSTKSSDQSELLEQRSRAPSSSVLTHEKLQQLMPRLLHKTGLRNLPRSNADKIRHKTKHSITTEEGTSEVLVEPDRRQSTCTINCFPPLESRRISLVCLPPSYEDLSPKPIDTYRSRLGSMIGASCHAKKHTANATNSVRRRSSVIKSLLEWSDKGMTGEAPSHDDDTSPLLPRVRQ